MLENEFEIFKVGILIPTYNRPEFLNKTLNSVLGQTFANLEIIVIDNGSADATKRLMAGVADARVRYVTNELNLGLIGSINKGMRLFSTEVNWCTILPDDDLLDHEFAESMVDYVGRHYGIHVVHGHRVLIGTEGEKISEASIPPELETSVEYLINRSRSVRQTFLTGVFFSRLAFEQIGGYPQFTTGMASDDALIFGLSLGQGLYFNNNAIALVRMHPEAESLSSANVFGHIQAFMDFRNYILRLTVADNTFTNNDLKRIRRALQSYTCTTISVLWLRRVHELLLHDLSLSGVELSDLNKFVWENELPFSLRVRIDSFMVNNFRWNLERSTLYRIFWSVVSLLKIRSYRRS
jgi:glycosyltransferase involved in cell wall biosynthesis